MTNDIASSQKFVVGCTLCGAQLSLDGVSNHKCDPIAIQRMQQLRNARRPLPAHVIESGDSEEIILQVCVDGVDIRTRIRQSAVIVDRLTSTQGGLLPIVESALYVRQP